MERRWWNFNMFCNKLRLCSLWPLMSLCTHLSMRSLFYFIVRCKWIFQSDFLSIIKIYNENSNITDLEAHWSLEINLKSPNKSICSLSSKNNRKFYYKINIHRFILWSWIENCPKITFIIYIKYNMTLLIFYLTQKSILHICKYGSTIKLIQFSN